MRGLESGSSRVLIFTDLLAGAIDVLRVLLAFNFSLPALLMEAGLFSVTMWLCTSHDAGCGPSASISDVRNADTNGAVWAPPVSGVAPSRIVHGSPMTAIKYREPAPLYVVPRRASSLTAPTPDVSTVLKYIVSCSTCTHRARTSNSYIAASPETASEGEVTVPSPFSCACHRASRQIPIASSSYCQRQRRACDSRTRALLKLSF